MENTESYNRLDDSRLSEVTIAATMTPPTSLYPLLPTPGDPSNADRTIRERCFTRYVSYVNRFVGIVMLLDLVAMLIVYLLRLPDNDREKYESIVLAPMLLTTMTWIVFVVLKFLCELCVGKMCIVPYWCGCPCIERHQLRYEENQAEHRTP